LFFVNQLHFLTIRWLEAYGCHMFCCAECSVVVSGYMKVFFVNKKIQISCLFLSVILVKTTYDNNTETLDSCGSSPCNAIWWWWKPNFIASSKHILHHVWLIKTAFPEQIWKSNCALLFYAATSRHQNSHVNVDI